MLTRGRRPWSPPVSRQTCRLWSLSSHQKVRPLRVVAVAVWPGRRTSRQPLPRAVSVSLPQTVLLPVPAEQPSRLRITRRSSAAAGLWPPRQTSHLSVGVGLLPRGPLLWSGRRDRRSGRLESVSSRRQRDHHPSAGAGLLRWCRTRRAFVRVARLELRRRKVHRRLRAAVVCWLFHCARQLQSVSAELDASWLLSRMRPCAGRSEGRDGMRNAGQQLTTDWQPLC